ncbi:hypothetical protein GALMADRAFT_138636 [Galerina marginata CBS 339.88]|uniref:F-box domain-containing protein n=1 Tax=Galerina marginata (strain CBS 339.88) TaxID=685588 RepID=A0A067T5E3_GALM3|nr:hypothetical protein GALMADRAFT_138636 [Galerina marginata CBS 339.88]
MATPAQVPIHFLDIDVLLYIFSLNANIFLPSENPLKTTRFASQDDILQRIGHSSSLWIKATSKISQQRTSVVQKIKAFFFSILGTHWARIEVLAVKFDVHGLDSKLLRAIYLPAPRLRVFDLDFHGFLPEFDVNWEADSSANPTAQALFANEAPFLFTFHAAFIKPNLRAPWFPNIRSLRLGSFFTLTELLDVLKWMQLLEAINIRQPELISSDGPLLNGLSHIHLPNLRYIRLESEITTGVALLQRIRPARGCSLSVCVSELGADLRRSENLAAALDSLSKFARDYFTYHFSTSISLEISSDFFSFQDKSNPTNSPSDSILDVSIFLSDGISSTDISLLLTSFTFPTPAFDSVTTLELKASTSEYKIYAPFAVFFHSFPSVKKLIIDEAGLNSIFNVQIQNPQSLFPVLDTLQLDCLPFNLSEWDNIQGIYYTSIGVSYFLRLQKNSGHPVSVLDLTTCPMDTAPKLACSDEMTGGGEAE